MMNRVIILIPALLFCTLAYSQERVNFGFGGEFGWKGISNETGFGVSLRIKQYFSVKGLIGYGKFSGFGYSMGINGYLLNKNFQPFLGFYFNHQDGTRFSIDEKDKQVHYHVSKHNFTNYQMGGRWTLFFDDPNYRNYISVLPYVSYRHHLREPVLEIEEGMGNVDYENDVRSRISDGFGVGLSITYYFGDKE